MQVVKKVDDDGTIRVFFFCFVVVLRLSRQLRDENEHAEEERE